MRSINKVYMIEEVEDINTRYDMEENFPINEKLANKINGMIYKGIQVQYIWDTNTILFHKVKEVLNDSDDIDCRVYRNYTEDDLERYIETELHNFIDEKESELNDK